MKTSQGTILRPRAPPIGKSIKLVLTDQIVPRWGDNKIHNKCGRPAESFSPHSTCQQMENSCTSKYVIFDEIYPDTNPKLQLGRGTPQNEYQGISQDPFVKLNSKNMESTQAPPPHQ